MKPKKPDDIYRISWTRALTWHKCGVLFDLKYNQHKYPEDTYDMRLGSAVHAVAAVATMAAKDGNELGREEIGELWRAALKDKMRRGEIKPADFVDCWQGLVDWSLYAFYQRETIHGAEVDMDIPYSANGKVALRVIIDAIFLTPQGVKIIDVKNSRGITPKADLADNEQLMIYGYAANELLPGKQEVIAGHFYTRHNSDNLVTFQANRLLGIREWIDQALEGIMARKYEARVNRDCPICPARGSCPEFASRFKGQGGRPSTVARVHARLQKVNVSIKLLEVEKEKLRGYLGLQAEESEQLLVEGGKLAYYHKIETPRSIPADKFIEICRAAGYNPSGELLVGTTQADSIIKRISREMLSKADRDTLRKTYEDITNRSKRTKLVLGKPLPKRALPSKSEVKRLLTQERKGRKK